MEAAGPAGIPVARLAVAAGETPEAGADHRAIHHARALLPLARQPWAARWDLVHAHVGYPVGAAATELATRLARPLVITEHASFLATLLAEPVARDRYRDATLAADRVIAVSTMLAGEMTRMVPELEGRILVIPNAVAVEDFGGGSEAERVPGELLWVGARLETKGIETLLRAFSRVKERAPNAVLRLVGPPGRPGDDDRWHRLAGELGITAAVRFEPPADRSGVAAAMRRADLFVHPSPRETFGVVAVEALAAGLPVVAADSGGVTEILGPQPDRLGAVAPAGNPDALATAILGALERRGSFDPGQLRAWAGDHFSAGRVAARITAVYEEVLAARGPRQSTALAAPAAAHPGAGGSSQEPEAGVTHGSVTGITPNHAVVVVGFARLELDRALAAFPAWVFVDTVVVTCGGPVAGHPHARLAPAGTETAVTDVMGWGAPPTSGLGSLGRFLRRAEGRLESSLAARLSRTGDGGVGGLLDVLARVVAESLPAGTRAGLPVVVCLGGLDHLAVEPLVAAGRAVVAPGGLRWLADRRATDQPETPPAPGTPPAPSDA